MFLLRDDTISDECILQLWDVVEDQAAVQLVRDTADPRKAAEDLLDHAYRKYSTDNVTVLVIRFRNPPEPLKK